MSLLTLPHLMLILAGFVGGITCACLCWRWRQSLAHLLPLPSPLLRCFVCFRKGFWPRYTLRDHEQSATAYLCPACAAPLAHLIIP